MDIAPAFIELAGKRLAPNLHLHFEVHDHEQPIPFGPYDCAVIFDALHHADDEMEVIRSVSQALKPGGTFILLEPGRGHSQTEDSMEAARKYGTTEKDMPFSHFKSMLLENGFDNLRQFLRVKQLPLANLASEVGPYHQIQNAAGLCYETAHNGLTSLVVATKKQE